MKFGFPFLGGWCREPSVCMAPASGSTRQALGGFGAGLRHRQSFKDLIYERTQNTLAQINPEHLLFALSALKEARLSPRGCFFY